MIAPIAVRPLICSESPPLHQRLTALINQHFSKPILCDRLQDLPQQFALPHPRPWPVIAWTDINPEQVVGIELKVFLAILKGAIETEMPIRDYTQTSRQYLEQLHPAMAKFVGGEVSAQGQLLSPGLWEREERRHTPALTKIYTQLAGVEIAPTPYSAKPYLPSIDPQTDLLRHGLHRVATEYGAACLYIWLMAHSTDPLQAVLAELVKDEVNHMTKFLGFGIWFFPDFSSRQAIAILLKPSQHPSQLLRTLRRMTTVLNWSSWSMSNKLSFAFTCCSVLHRLWGWRQSLTPECLENMLGPVPPASI
ncbi:MAG: ferritin-like domain-containing protein [Aphanocapsa sp. GSE-SYN-MK-11-07L]|jgi:hypothetical protein|nr:ferritin-like domain-containing protein [Aphanocapsa sp. GSE-SYN-MK-11-07L]